MPQEIFENSKSLEQRVIAKDEGLEVERIEFNPGIRIYLKGHAYPQKGLPTVEAIQAINASKRLILESLGYSWRWAIFPKKRLLKSFNSILWAYMSPHLLKYEFQTPVTQELIIFIETLVSKWGTPVPKVKEIRLLPLCERENSARVFAKIVAHIFEYDQAYRFRLQDLASESFAAKLIENPQKELKRLLEINRQRDYETISKKFSMIGRILIYTLYYPPFKKAFTRAIKQIDFSKLQFDESDLYWASLKTDYNYGGTIH